MSMDEIERYVLGAVAVVVFLYFLSRLCAKDKQRNLEVYQALRSPSVRDATNAFDRRLALATREAAKGFRLCPGCGFENAQRGAVCMLCGAAMPAQHTSLTQFFNGAKDHSVEECQVNPSSRQRRIRRRKEWTRQWHDGGTILWQYDAQCGRAQLASDHSAYVLQVQQEILEEPSPSATCNQVAIDMEPATKLTREPLETWKTAKVNVVAVTHGCEIAQSSLGMGMSGPASTTLARESARNGRLDFPTKLAHFISATAALFRETTQEGSTDEAPVARLSVLRESLLKDTIDALASLTPAQARGAIRVEFIGEQGIDAGGVYREWMQLVNQAIVAPETGIYTCVNPQEQAFYLNSNAPEILGEDYWAHFLAAGRLLGRALLEGNVTGFHLAQPLLKIILRLPVSLDDLEYYDPEIHKNLKWLLDNEGVDALCLDFTATEKLPSGETRTVELMAGGCEMDVTDANKLEYVDLKLNYLLFESVSSQLRAFLRGVYEVVPLELLMLFDAEELDLVLSGSDVIDVDDWEAHTLDDVDTGGRTQKRLRNLPCYENFWKVVRELSIDERRRLLQFTTGSTRPPPGGFGSLTSYDGRLSLFTLRGVPIHTTHGNLQSHACFNRLDLPTYWGLKSMREAVHAAISGDVDGFTID